MPSQAAQTVYARLLAAGVPLDHHESDLYAKITDDSTRILAADRSLAHVRRFVSAIDGQLWFDIPFAYQPFWDRLRL